MSRNTKDFDINYETNVVLICKYPARGEYFSEFPDIPSGKSSLFLED